MSSPQVFLRQVACKWVFCNMLQLLDRRGKRGQGPAERSSGDRHSATTSLELQIAEVVAKPTARRCGFACRIRWPEVPTPAPALRPGQFLTLRACPLYRFGGALLLGPLQFAHRRRAGGRSKTADRYASNWSCDRTGGHASRAGPVGPSFVPTTLDADFLLLAAGSGITNHVDLQIGACRERWTGDAALPAATTARCIFGERAARG